MKKTNAKKVVIVIGGPVKNMGSQAIVRGLIKILKLMNTEITITVVATDDGFNKSLNLPCVDKYMSRYSISSGKMNFPRLVNGFKRRLKVKGHNEAFYKLYYLLKECKSSQLVIIVGADNYDNSYHSVPYMRELNQYLPYFGSRKAVLFDCSVGPNDLTQEAREDIDRFSYITARESISYETLKNAFGEDRVKFFPDIAFCMDPEKVELPNGFENDNTIGINASSLISDGRYGVTEQQVLEAYQSLINHILRTTRLKVCFIPHVKGGADLSILKRLYSSIECKNRLIFIDHENFNAAQKKYVISRCRFFIGARTHATIAAYSSCVPTIVVGYSIKSKGIAADLFGTSDNYVVPLRNLASPSCLIEAFDFLLTNENVIKEKLRKVMPDYIAKTTELSSYFQGIIEDDD